MTLQSGQPVHLSFADWMRLISLVVVVVGSIIGVLYRQESLIRDVVQSQKLLEYRVQQLEERRG